MYLKFLILFLFPISLYAQNRIINNFGSAKGVLRKIYGKGHKTIYCSCEFQKNSIKSKNCHLLTKKYKKRAKRLEWEHIVPAHAFGQSFPAWRQASSYCPDKKNSKGKLKKVSGRKCAAKKNELFRFMEADLYNLAPAVGAINALRSNFSMTDGIDSKYELCKGGIRLQARKVSPPDSIKGDIARVYQYMDSTYPGRGIISKKNTNLYSKWSDLDPISSDECVLYFAKKAYQKSENSVLEKPCKKILGKK